MIAQLVALNDVCNLAKPIANSVRSEAELDVAGSASRHSPSRVVAYRLRLLGSVNSRFGLHRLRKQYLIVFASLTQQGEP